jgi:hypothetical protein
MHQTLAQVVPGRRVLRDEQDEHTFFLAVAVGR